MKKLFPLFLFLICNILYSQDLVKYFSYKMEDPKKSYNVFLSYDENKNLDVLMIDVSSEDPIYDKSSFILYGKEDLEKFRIFLRLALIKKTEWDSQNLINNEGDIVKKMDLERNMKVTCKYYKGPSYPDSTLYSTYVYLSGKSAISISTPTYEDIERSQILFLDQASIQNFIKKIQEIEVQNFINKDYEIRSRLK